LTFWTYILHCRGGAYYTGQTDHLEQRIAAHETGRIVGFTSNRLPVVLVWSAEFQTRIEALAMERRIKGWTKAKKMALIRGDFEALSELSKAKDSPSTSSGRTDGF